ncbi:MAG: GPW/gp25 family protein [Bacteroidia bacterium]|nr:GPW/gp25 family protein [Bacteroidia bacterium]
MFDFIGRGWSFPPTFRKETGGLDMLEGADDIRSSIEILLSTLPGERVMRPDYGAGMERLLFEPLNITLQNYLERLIAQAIALHEPRVILDLVELEVAAEEGLVLIKIEYTVAGTNTRSNFVYPFYLNEGTEIQPL